MDSVYNITERICLALQIKYRSYLLENYRKSNATRLIVYSYGETSVHSISAALLALILPVVIILLKLIWCRFSINDVSKWL